MILPALCFYLFSAVTLISAVMVIGARNPVHSVLFLILSFFSAAGLFILLRAEFLAMILIIVYVGAVAVLFMFVVMMLNINVSALREGFARYWPLGGAIGVVLLVELVLATGVWTVSPEVAPHLAASLEGAGEITQAVPMPGVMSNTRALGQVLYTNYVYLFQTAGLVLLVAMVGAIVLTLRRREGVRHQDIAVQVSRSREESVELRKVEKGKGI